MEMNLNTGKGYVPAELNKPEEPPLGLIAMNRLLVVHILLVQLGKA